MKVSEFNSRSTATNLLETQAFVAIVTEGSLAKAGKRLGVSKSTLCRRLSNLEDRVGGRLLQRNSRQVATTDVGEQYYRTCLEAMNLIAAAELSVHEQTEAVAGRIRVSASWELGMGFVVPLLGRFLATYPDVQICLEFTQENIDLIASGYDVALRGGVLPASELVVRRLLPSCCILCATPNYLQSRPPITEAGLSRERVLLPSYLGHDASSSLTLEASGQPPLRLSITPSCASNSMLALKELALQSAGIALIEENLVRAQLRSGVLVRVLPDYTTGQGGGAYAVIPSRSQVPARVKLFVDFLAEEIPKLCDSGQVA